MQQVGPIEEDKEYLESFPEILQQSKYLGKKGNFNTYLYPRYPKIDQDNYKTILFIGETGSGKTSTINYFLNYYIGVQFEDDIRFQLIDEVKQCESEACSQTQDVNIYYVKPINGNDGLKIVDTPGFNDTRGMSQDQLILKKIQNCFEKDIDSVSAICFLIKASETRLTPAQQYVFSSIIKIFGKDIIKNLIFFFPFFDSTEEEDEPNVLQVIKFQGDTKTKNQKSCLADVFTEMVDPKFIKYNNTTLISNNTKEYNEIKWDYHMNQFNEFKEEKLTKTQPTSLQLTLDVIKARENTNQTIRNLRNLIGSCLNQMKIMKETYREIAKMEPDLVASQDFTYIKTVYHTVTHERCSGVKQKHISSKKKSTQSKSKSTRPTQARATKQKNKPQSTRNQTQIRFEPIITKHQEQVGHNEVAINENMKKLFDKLSKEKMSKEVILDNIINEFCLQQVEYYKLQNEFQKSALKLQEIALKPKQSVEEEQEYIQRLLEESLNLEEKKNLKEILEDFKMLSQQEKLSGDSKITHEFFEKMLQAKIQGTLKNLLSQE